MAGYALLAAFIALLLVARTMFVRYRRSLPVYAEFRIAKSRLPRWVLAVETVVQLLLFLVVAALFASVLILVAVIAGAPPPVGAPINALIPLTCFVAGIGPALLLSNAVSMSIPALHRANGQAFAGLQTASVRLANKNLWQLSAVLIPYGVTFAVLGLFLGSSS